MDEVEKFINHLKTFTNHFYRTALLASWRSMQNPVSSPNIPKKEEMLFKQGH